MTTFVEQHKDFVLKLKFLGDQNEVAEIRRVRLPRIIKDATVSYEELVGIAISFVIPKNPTSESDFEVKLTYQDVDDDTVVIGSSEELLDAIEQFSEQKVLRITAVIKRFEKKSAATTTTTTTTPSVPPAAVSPSLSRAPSESTSSMSSEAGARGSTATPPPPTPPANTPVLTKAVESVVNIILNAAVAINSRGGQEGASDSPVYYAPDGVPAPTSSAATEDVPSEEPAPSSTEVAPKVEAKEEKPEEKPAAAEKPKEVAEKPKEVVEKAQPNNTKATEEAKDDDKKPAAEERPFIHGRHTCDSCLTTPIVGKRYHAVNMSDYDLCSKCFSNYSGTEITFEAVELERDRHLQGRWNRRRDRMNNAKGRGGNNRRRFGPRFGPEGQHHKRWGPPAGPHQVHPHPPPPPHGPSPPPPPPHGPGFPPHMPHHPPPFMGGPPVPPGPPPPFPPPPMPAACPPPAPGVPVPGPPLPWYSLAAPRNEETKQEGDLEKAIRLSLEEAQKKKAPPAPAVQEAPKKKAPPAASMPVVDDDIESNITKPSAVEEQVETASVKTNTEKAEKAVVAVKAAPIKLEVVEPVLVETVNEAEEEKKRGIDFLHSSPPCQAFTKTNRGVVDVIHSVPPCQGFSNENKDTEELKVASVEAKPSAPAEEEVMAEEKDASVVSDPFVVQMPSDNSIISEIKSVGSRHSAEAKEESNSEPSFTLDAAGNGDVADLLGSTLDACAEAIDAMVTELSRESSADSASSTNSSYVGVEENQGAGSEQAAETEGATILESVGSPQVQEAEVQSVSARSEEDWQVVSEDQQVSNDEELARAAQMIGSALFNSDMRSSQELLSTLSGSNSDGMSFASSVPTISNNTVTTFQRERWAPQLAKLHTMGIDNDNRSVEILERLEAANIGSGCENDEISVERVLDELWNKN